MAYGVLLILGLIYLAFALLLLVKLVEAGLRIYGRLEFGEAGQSADNGLYGVCVILGCCGGRRQKRDPTGRRRYRATHIPRDNASEVSSYLPPAGVGGPSPSSASQHSAPVSVLRPEHALRPYREDSDDESGYIMGAWQPFPRPEYQNPNAVSSTSRAAHPNTSTTSGFSKVGGGRAHFDSPYAISGENSSVTFPNAAHNTLPPTPPQRRDYDDEPTASVANLARQPQKANAALPPGAMFPHTRTRSHTAIVELAAVSPDVSLLQVVRPTLENTRRPSSAGTADESTEEQTSKKKSWYQTLKMSRRHSDGSESLARQVDVLDEPPPTGGSFVVLREKRPSPSHEPSSSRSNPLPNSDRVAPDL